ncbi:TetR family transcriptional regulator [Chromobacterium phragmitis]|uniref:TetR family transcriptional regulator n=1 Tax=Chromobacterium phragmitis TaxID=2202141 RepID=A0A344UDE5_9NEIS|nr:TetR family transcriptional regulator [Chromobacterium phragmitis]AXE33293.1 TetR family transcriptional regulator [Chromobacterium phragmitis]
MGELEPVGRRERKKMQLRESLIKAAYELFNSKGFDQTRIEDITDQVDVSSRTFFRYFASKEEVVLDYQKAEHEDIVKALESRPVGEPLLSSLRCAAVNVVRSCEQGAFGFDADRYMTLQNLLRAHPLVRARSFAQSEMRHADMVRIVAEKMGITEAADVRPVLLVATLDFAHGAAYQIWKRDGGGSVRLYSQVLDQVFQLIETGLNFPYRLDKGQCGERDTGAETVQMADK